MFSFPFSRPSTNLRLYTVTCIEGKIVKSFVAPLSCPVYSVRGKLVFNQLAPPVICEYIYTHLLFFFRLFTNTHAYTHAAKTSSLFKNSRVLETSIEQNIDELLPIFDYKTSFGFPVSKAFYPYLFQHDP